MKNETINVHDDNLMRAMGFLRPFDQTPRDKSVWTKTSSEKKALKKAKHSTDKRDMHFNNIPRRRVTFKAKLIVYLKPNKVFSKTTYSQICPDTKVDEILSNFRVTNSKTGYSESIVSKYYYNGKTYTC